MHSRQVHGIPVPGRDAISRTRVGRVAGGSTSAGEHAIGCVEPAASGVLLDALVLKGLSQAGAPRPVACVSTRS